MLARVADAVEVKVGADLVLHDPVADRYVRLNPAASALWARLEQPRTAEELASALVIRYRLEPHRARADTEAFVAALLDRRLIRVIDGDAQIANARSTG